jgi:GDP-L-fucose synthase
MDAARAIPLVLDKHNGPDPLIVSPDENLSIREMALMIRKALSSDAKIKFNGALEGQFRKDGSNKMFKSLFPDFEFTPFEEGVRETYNWFKSRGLLL